MMRMPTFTVTCTWLMLSYVFLIQPATAKDLGVMGQTYPIIEEDFLQFIKSRIESMQKNGQWQQLQKRMQQEAMRYRDRPAVVTNMMRIDKTKTWLFDPTIVLDHDVITPNGKLIASAGTSINPLSYITVTKTLIFFDGDDEKQVRWVFEKDKALNGNDKLILVNGSVLTEEKNFKKNIYFDQEGKLTSHFGITHVPAVVSQEGKAMRITESQL